METEKINRQRTRQDNPLFMLDTVGTWAIITLIILPSRSQLKSAQRRLPGLVLHLGRPQRDAENVLVVATLVLSKRGRQQEDKHRSSD